MRRVNLPISDLRMMYEGRMSLARIAEKFGVSIPCVANYVKRYGFSKRIHPNKGRPAWNRGLRTKWIIQACLFCKKTFGSWLSSGKVYCSHSCDAKNRRQYNFKPGIQNNPKWREALKKAWASKNPFKFKKGKHPSPKTEFKKGHKSTLGRKRPLRERLVIGKERKEFFRAHPHKHPNYILRKSNFISKPQRQLYALLKRQFPDAVLNLPIVTPNRVRFADVGIPSLKLDVEYDGGYWHQSRRRQDERRDIELRSVGWNTLRINSLGMWRV